MVMDHTALTKFDEYRKEAQKLKQQMVKPEDTLTTLGVIQTCVRYALSYLEGPISSFAQARRILIGLEDLASIAETLVAQGLEVSNEVFYLDDFQHCIRQALIDPSKPFTFLLEQVPLISLSPANVTSAVPA